MAAQYTQNATISSTSQGLDDLGFSSDQINKAYEIHLTVRDADISYRCDGTDPTATVGHIFKKGETYSFDMTKTFRPGNLEMIRATGTDAAVFVELVSEA